jgi:hypothetical protein
MRQKSSLTQLAPSVRQVLTGYALLELKRHLSALEVIGNLPALASDLPANAKMRRPHSRFAA